MKRYAFAICGGIIAALCSSTLYVHAHTVNHAPVYYRNQVITLMYHEVDTRKLPGDFITPGTFSEELHLLRVDGFHVISLSQLTAFLNGRKPIPDNAVLITFDNGYQSFYRTAFPLLKRYHDPVTLFAIVHWLYPSHSPDQIHRLSWTEVKQMYRTGLLDVQSQTFDLHKAVAVSPHATQPATVGRAYDWASGRSESLAQYDAHVLTDLRRARLDLMHKLHEHVVSALAYPFGDYTPQLIRLAHEAGYRYMFTATFGWGILQKANPAFLFRINAGYPNVTPAGLISTIESIASLTARGGLWNPPGKFVQTWTNGGA